MTDIRATLDEREHTHGDYGDHADTTQRLKGIIRAGRAYDSLDAHERETLDMIAHKVGRIVSGNPHFHDHWHDIAGYATLSADRNKPNEPPLVEPPLPPSPLKTWDTCDETLDRALNLFSASKVQDRGSWLAAAGGYALDARQCDRGWRFIRNNQG